MAKINCCRYCDKRYPACHDQCEIYQAEKEKVKEAKTNEAKYVLIESTIKRHKTEIWWRMQKGHRR